VVILLCPICGEEVRAESGEVRCPMCGHLMAVVPARAPRANYAGDPVPAGFDSGCLSQLVLVAAILAAPIVVVWLVVLLTR
jgi:DNA-directed RNA polymerase subunit RPC12/RpoP